MRDTILYIGSRNNFFGRVSLLFSIVPLIFAVVVTNAVLPSSKRFWKALERDDDIMNLIAHVESEAAINRSSSARRAPTLYVIGDSSIREGVDASALSAHLDMRVVKLGFAGGTPFESLLVVRRLMPRPGDCLAIGVSPYEFSNETNTREYMTARPSVRVLMGASDALRILPNPTPDDIAQGFLRDVSVAYRYRQYVREYLFGGFEPAPWMEFRYTRRISGRDFHSKLSDGSYVLTSAKATLGPGHVNYRALAALKSLSDRLGTRFCIVCAPLNPVLLPPTDGYTQVERSVIRLYGRLLSEYHTVNPGSQLTDNSHFNDFMHLNAEGRRLYTAGLAEELKAVLSPH